jgi:hypothetical protein
MRYSVALAFTVVVLAIAVAVIVAAPEAWPPLSILACLLIAVGWVFAFRWRVLGGALAGLLGYAISSGAPDVRSMVLCMAIGAVIGLGYELTVTTPTKADRV